MRSSEKPIVVICPGGAYCHLSPRESEPVARAFEKMGALADEYEYLMQSSYEKGEASGYEKGEASGFKKGEASGFEKGETSVREDFINYWVDEVTRLVRTKGMSLEEAMDDCRVRSEYISAVSERCRAILHGV